ncbi:Methyltransferase domain-containing protein [Melghirimyces thermohalophilus]|uniref:Methyltransferase domain-containing protein n=1 Tax=Melghirimyces thermohalophilus TaxID=1236220 RepID=A0A1G6N3F1_9BACL|nr:Methyltransferase domain-containing protein [Melghirimyces thermohalophilus]
MARKQVKRQVQQQFQQSASGYLNSSIHASGADLDWIAKEVEAHPSPSLALDLATGTGHTAFVLSRFCRRVIGYDLTPEMRDIAAQEAGRREIDNIT